MLSTETKLAFDLKKYQNLSLRQREKQFTSDLTALAVETQPRKESPPITPYDYTVNFTDNTVICQEFSSKDVRCHFTSPDVLETCNLLLDPTKYEKGVMVILWISPPSGKDEPESRITLTVSEIVDDQKAQAKNYSGLCTTLSPNNCLQVANYANSFSSHPRPEFSRAEKINHFPIQISVPDGLDPYEFILTSIIPLADVLERITSGKADRDYKEKRKSAERVAEVIAPAMIGLTSSPDLVRLGAQAEQMMVNLTGTRMVSSGSGCGALNSELLNSNAALTGISFPGVTNLAEVHNGCQEIVCPNCGWKPSTSELTAIQNNTLTCCPNRECHYNPATKSINPEANPIYETRTSPPIFGLPTFNFQEINPPKTKKIVKEVVTLPWIIYFFSPWLNNIPEEIIDN